VGVVILLYGQVAGHEFVGFDDDRYIFANPHVRQGLTWEGVKWAFSGFHVMNWHPLTWLSHMLDVQLFGLEAGGHLLVNVALHAANAVLLFVALRQMTGTLWPCAFVAALFAMHPMRVESVAWASERKDVLSGLFWMLTMLAYAGYARRPAAARYLLVFAALALGLMVKPMLVTLPCVLLLLDLWPLGRWRPGSAEREGPGRTPAAFAPRPISGLVLEKLPLLGLCAVSGAATLLAQRSGGAVSSLEAMPFASRLANALVAYVAYLRKTIWPSDLACFYPHPAAVSSDPAALIGAAIGAGLVLGCITLLAAHSARRRPYLTVGWFWYLGTLVPVIGLFQVGTQAMADRYAYLPLVGIYILAAWGVRDLAARRPRVELASKAAAPILLAAFGAATWHQVGTWQNSRTLYEHALRVTSDNYLIHNNLGAVLEKEGRIAEATGHFERALRIRPAFAPAHTNLGNVLLRRGDPAQAAVHYQRALRLDPDNAEAQNNLGSVFESQGRLAEAQDRFERALRIRPNYADAHYNLGVVFEARGDLTRAAAQYQHAVRLDPDHAKAHGNLGIVLIRQGKLAEAAARLERALEIDPDDAKAHYNRGIVFVRQGNLAQAWVCFERALTADPGFDLARERLAESRRHLGNRQQP
jgi:Tfp pilus assembly protein PilF